MSLFGRISGWGVFQILFLIAAVIIVEMYLRKGQDERAQSTNAVVEQPTPSSSPSKKQSRISDLKLSRVEICLDIDVDERKPLFCKDSFNRNVDKLYCYTQVRGLRRSSYIIHRWYHEETLRAEERLDVSATPTGTWSYLEMKRNWAGAWHVDVLAPDGSLLASVPFELY